MDSPGGWISAMSSHVTENLVARTTTLADNNRGRTLVIVTWFLMSVSILVVCARCWSKVKHARQLFFDDAIMILAVLHGIVFSVLVQLAVCDGYGRHGDRLTQGTMAHTALLGSLSMLFGALGAMAGRISFCCTLLFLIKTDSRMRNWHVYIFIVFQVVVNVFHRTGIIVLFTECGTSYNDTSNNLNDMNYYDSCSNPKLQIYMKYAVGISNAITDLYLAVLPAILISHTKVSLKAKLGMGSLLCLSGLALVAATAKTYEAKALQDLTDYTWSLVPYTLCTTIELNIIIISASVPLLRPLFRRNKPTRFSLKDDTWPGSDHIALNSVAPTPTRDTWPSDVKREGSGSTSLTRSRSEGITVTTVVDVSFHERSAPVIHASLIGLMSDSDYIRYPDFADNKSRFRRRCW